jgi:hypothetical protein
MRVRGAMFCVWLVLMMGVGFAQGVEESVQEKEAAPIIEVEKPTFDFDQVLEGKEVKHAFRVFNRGTAPLEIKSVKPG